MNAEGCAQVRLTLLLGGAELWWPHWGSSRKTAHLRGTHVLHRLGPWAWGPGLCAREDSVCMGALTSWYGNRLSLSVPHSYPLLKDRDQVFFSFLSPAPSTGPGAK